MENTLKLKSNKPSLIEGPILKSLLIFAAPIVLTNVVQQLYTLVDVAVIGKCVQGTVGTVAVNTGGEVADLLAPIATGFAMAGQIYLAQLVGAGDDSKTKRAVGTLLTFMLGLSLILSAISIFLSGPILNWLNCPAEAFSAARIYMIISAIGTPFVFGYNAVCGVLRGMGESKRPLIFILVAASINIILDIFLVAVLHLEAAGTAIATVAAQFGSFAAAFYFMWKAKEKFDFELKASYFKIDMKMLWIFIKLGIPQVFRSMCVRFGIVWCNSQANGFGSVVSAANGIGNKLQKLLDCFVSGIDTAAASMIGQNLGARKQDRARKVTLYTVASALVCATVVSAVILIFPTQVFSIFTSDAGVVELGRTYLRIFVLHFYQSAITGSFQAMVTGCGFVSLGFVLGILDGLICKIGFSCLFMNIMNMGYIGLWWGVAASRVPNGFITIWYFLSNKWRYRKLLTD